MGRHRRQETNNVRETARGGERVRRAETEKGRERDTQTDAERQTV